MGKFPKSIVLVTDNTLLGGAELSLIELLKQFVVWGIDCYLITRNRGELFEEFKKYTKDQLVLTFPYPSKFASWVHYLSFKRDASRFINAIEGDKVILVGDLYPLWAVLQIRDQIGAPVYSMFQGEYVFEDDSCVRKWIKYGANRADKLIASEYICSHANSLGLMNKEVESLNPKVDLTRFKRTLYNRDEVRRKLGFSSDDKLAICVGQIGVAKGQPWLAREFLSNQAIYGSWHLLIVGPMRDAEDEVFFKDLKLQDEANRLHLLGLRKDVPELYVASDLALFGGTVNESFGLAVVEAAIMELPIFALRTGCIPYTLGDKYSGLFAKNKKDMLIGAWAHFRPGDGERLKKAIDVDGLRGRLSEESWLLNLSKLFTLSF